LDEKQQRRWTHPATIRDKFVSRHLREPIFINPYTEEETDADDPDAQRVLPYGGRRNNYVIHLEAENKELRENADCMQAEIERLREERHLDELTDETNWLSPFAVQYYWRRYGEAGMKFCSKYFNYRYKLRRQAELELRRQREPGPTPEPEPQPDPVPPPTSPLTRPTR
jgi:hypothetical protein